MNSDKAVDIFNCALEIKDPGQRRDYLVKACSGDAELLARVQRFLAENSEAEASFPTEPGGNPGRDDSVAERGGELAKTVRRSLSAIIVMEGPGSPIGKYMLLRELGEGGMGIVYLAEHREDYHQQVALKIIKPGMDSRQVIARFEAERQALALMDHPNIARVMDGGCTESGRPYFVMQYVKGMSITRYCDREHLSTRERLELFRQVCQAVQHAHNKGIIHRDVKPTNILVTLVDGKPVPMVIDFGIAKALNQRLTEKTLFTEKGQMIGTPAYMSPEQAAGESMDIDARTDIYSLGVLLYELMVGRTPFDEKTLREKGYDEIRRIIREVEPPRPSTRLSTLSGEELTALARQRRIDANRLGRFLRGDLDVIVMTAISKEPSRRYKSATSLAEDVGRFLSGDTIIAQPPSTADQLRKFMRRHRKTVATIAAMFLVLILGVATTTWQYFKATTAGKRAEQSAQEAEEVIRFLNEMLDRVRPARALGRDTAMLREILDATAANVDPQLAGQPRVTMRLLATMGRTYTALGVFTNAEALQLRALAIAREQFGGPDTNVAVQLIDLAYTVQSLTRFTDASNHVAEALAICEQRPGGEAHLTARALHRLGSIQIYLGDHSGAERSLTNALAVETRLLGADDPETLYTGRDFALLLFRRQRFVELEPVLLRVLAGQRRIHPPDHPDLLEVLDLLGLLRLQQGRYAEAESHFVELRNARERVLPPGHRLLLTAYDRLAMTYGYLGRHAAAEALSRRAVEGVAAISNSPPALTFQSNLAEYLRNQGRYAESEPLFLDVLARKEQARGVSDESRAETMNSLALQYYLQQRYAEAETRARACLNLRETSMEFLADDQRIADAQSQLVRILVTEGKFPEAQPLSIECWRIRQLAAPDDWRRGSAQSQLGGVLLGLNQNARAEPLLIRGYELIKQLRDRIPAIERGLLIEAGERLARYYEALNQPAAVIRVREELVPLHLWAANTPP